MRPTANVLYLPGTNCQAETLRAFKRVGADASLVFLSDVMSGAARLDGADILDANRSSLRRFVILAGQRLSRPRGSAREDPIYNRPFKREDLCAHPRRTLHLLPEGVKTNAKLRYCKHRN